MQYKVIQVDGIIRACINKKGKPSKYEEPKIFDSAESAGKWIDKHSYKGMSWSYQIERCKDESIK